KRRSDANQAGTDDRDRVDATSSLAVAGTFHIYVGAAPMPARNTPNGDRSPCPGASALPTIPSNMSARSLSDTETWARSLLPFTRQVCIFVVVMRASSRASRQRSL